MYFFKTPQREVTPCNEVHTGDLLKEMREKGRKEGRDRGRDGARDWSLGTKVMEEKGRGRKRKKENESKRNVSWEGPPFKGTIENVHKRCS